MVFTVLGAVAELERSLIVERVKAGLRNARAKGKRLGRPEKIAVPSRFPQPQPNVTNLTAEKLAWVPTNGIPDSPGAS
jgi:putative DNA-invertase from lambdoid prophage Rac